MAMDTYFTIGIVLSIVASVMLAWGLSALIKHLRGHKRESKEPSPTYEENPKTCRKLKEL